MKISQKAQACNLSPMRKFHPYAVEAKAKGNDVVIVDTAGRLAIDEQMMQEIAQNMDQEGFVAKNYFMSSPNLDISHETSNLMSDKYQLSKGQQMADEESLVGSYINHLMLDYKLLILKNQIQQLNKQLAQPEVIGDDDKCFGIMQQIANLNAVKRDMEKMLGDRVMN